MAERHSSGVLDTSTYIDLALLDPECLPEVPQLTSITMAELHQGIAMAKDGRDPKPRRMDLMIAAIASTRGMPLYTRNEEDFRALDDVLTVIAV